MVHGSPNNSFQGNGDFHEQIFACDWDNSGETEEVYGFGQNIFAYWSGMNESLGRAIAYLSCLYLLLWGIYHCTLEEFFQ